MLLLFVLIFFTKYCRFIPCFVGDKYPSTSSVEIIFFDNVIRLFDIPAEVISNREPRFTTSF